MGSIFGDKPKGPNIEDMMYSYNRYLDRQKKYQKRVHQNLMRNWRSVLGGTRDAFQMLRGSQHGAIADVRDIFRRTEGRIQQNAISSGLATTSAPNVDFRDNAGAYGRARANILADYASRMAGAKMNIAQVKGQRPNPYDRSWVPLTRMMIDQGLFTGGVKDEGSPGLFGKLGIGGYGNIMGSLGGLAGGIAGLGSGGLLGGIGGAMGGAMNPMGGFGAFGQMFGQQMPWMTQPWMGGGMGGFGGFIPGYGGGGWNMPWGGGGGYMY